MRVQRQVLAQVPVLESAQESEQVPVLAAVLDLALGWVLE